MSIDVMKQALEALERGETKLRYEAITALRAAIEQAQGLAEKIPAKGTLLEQTLGKVWDEMPHAALMDAIIGGTGVMLGDKRIDPASIYKQPEQEPVAWGVFDGPNLHDVNFTEEDAQEMVRLKGDGSVVKPLYTSTQPQMQPCAGRNCGSTNPNLHSAECFEDYEKATGMNHWQGLTDDEIKEIIGPWGETPIKGYTRKLFDQIEAKLKEKNT